MLTNMPNIIHWMEWKQTCALGLCGPEAQSGLQAYVHGRFLRYTSDYALPSKSSGQYPPVITPRDAWHWFETYFQLHHNREGKCYKAWLFARVNTSSTALQSIESGVSRLLRDVVRERLRKEQPHPRTQSLDGPHSIDSGTLSLEELLPCSSDTASEVEQRDLETLAIQLAEGVLGALTKRERIAMLTREQGLSYAHPDVLKRADCGKTMLAKAHPTALKKIAGHASNACPNESRSVQASLAIALFDVVRERLKQAV